MEDIIAKPGIESEPLSTLKSFEERYSPLVRAFVRAIRRNGAKPRLKKKSGTADMNILAPKFGVDAVAYGPGDSRLDHTLYERLNLREYLKAIEVLKTALEELKSI